VVKADFMETPISVRIPTSTLGNLIDHSSQMANSADYEVQDKFVAIEQKPGKR
jgi:hypothetical protein